MPLSLSLSLSLNICVYQKLNSSTQDQKGVSLATSLLVPLRRHCCSRCCVGTRCKPPSHNKREKSEFPLMGRRSNFTKHTHNNNTHTGVKWGYKKAEGLDSLWLSYPTNGTKIFLRHTRPFAKACVYHYQHLSHTHYHTLITYTHILVELANELNISLA